MSEAAPGSEGERTVAFLLALRAQGVRDIGVLRAMERIPRDRFAPARFADLARQDVSVPLACGQTMTAPHTVAALLGALQVEGGQRMLEIGTGSGYVTALLSAMGGRVVSLERYRTLALAAHERLSGQGMQVDLRHADGFRPDRGLGFFDRILVNGVTQAIPEALLARLSPGARLIGAIRVDGIARRVVVTSDGEGTVDHTVGPPGGLPPLAPGLSQAL